jgi:hypothetical protein
MKKILGALILLLVSCSQSERHNMNSIPGLSTIESTEISLFTKTKVINLSRDALSAMFENNSMKLMAQNIAQASESVSIGDPILVESVVNQQSVIDSIQNDSSIPEDQKLKEMQKIARSISDYYIVPIHSGNSVVAQVTVSALKIDGRLPSRYPVMLFEDFLPPYVTASSAKKLVGEYLKLDNSANVSVKAVSLSLDGDLYTRYNPSWLVSDSNNGATRSFLVSMGIPSTSTLDLMAAQKVKYSPRILMAEIQNYSSGITYQNLKLWAKEFNLQSKNLTTQSGQPVSNPTVTTDIKIIPIEFRK